MLSVFEGTESTDSWDVTIFVDTPQKVDLMELLIENKNNSSGKKSMVNYIEVVVTWTP